LIVLVNAFVAIATKFFPDREPEEIVVQASDSKTDDRVIAAIACAIKAKE
jgi:Na+-transporting methylmalonyl-CoA/oxaloacetate decarboxylase gamma subunit